MLAMLAKLREGGEGEGGHMKEDTDQLDLISSASQLVQTKKKLEGAGMGFKSCRIGINLDHNQHVATLYFLHLVRVYPH